MAVPEPVSVGILGSASVGMAFPEPVSVGIPRPVSVGVAVPEPVSVGIPGTVCIVPAPVPAGFSGPVVVDKPIIMCNHRRGHGTIMIIILKMYVQCVCTCDYSPVHHTPLLYFCEMVGRVSYRGRGAHAPDI